MSGSHDSRALAVAVLVAGGMVVASCSQLGLGSKYFLTPCAGDGPERNADFEIVLPPFELEAYYAKLEAYREHFEIRPIEWVEHAGRSFPIYAIRRRLASAPRLLVVAGVHGDERAALLAVPRILDALASRPDGAPGWDVEILAPANPVGAAYASRYNAAGCDINRDFGEFTTREAGAIRRVVEDYAPDVVVATHEGPQQGFFLIATRSADPELASRIVSALGAEGIELAEKSFLGLALGTPGLSVEGPVTAAGKRWLGLGSLGTYLESKDVATYTTESPWGSRDFEERIRGHVAAIEAILAAPPEPRSERGGR